MSNGVSLKATATGFSEITGKQSVGAFLLGMAIITASIFLGRSYAFFLPFLAFSIVMTLIWRRASLPWIFLVSVSAATPVAVSKEQFTCNTIFALWFTAFHLQYLSRLPKWVCLLTGIAIFGVLVSAINWLPGDATRTIMQQIMRQGTYTFNFVLAPFVLLPMAYLRMSGSRDNDAKLRGLLFCLILPSTLMLLLAKFLGSPVNSWEASQHLQGQSEGFLVYQVGRVTVDFLRTAVGFILAALICASAAIAISRVKRSYRFWAGACLVSNIFLLLATASFGSGLSCFCGLAAIFFIQARKVNVTRVLGSAIVMICAALLIFILSPSGIREYLGNRYEYRVASQNTDRFDLWVRAAQQLVEHPEGVGWTLSVGEKVKTFAHNDYLSYAVSYSILGGIAYTGLIVGLLLSFFRMRKKVANEPSTLAVYLAGLGVIVAAAANSITDHMTEERWYFTVIWSLIWYCYFCSRPQVRSVQKAIGRELKANGGNDK